MSEDLGSLEELAIKLAIEKNWDEACRINQKILKEKPTDLDALNRLAFAYVMKRNYTKARQIYKKVVSLDKTNPIALKNLKKISLAGKKRAPFQEEKNLVNLYIEEAGKTKIVELKNIADKKTLSLLSSGTPVILKIKRSKIFVQTQEGKYIGMLPEALGLRLINFIKGGNVYEAFIKSVGEKSVSVFIRETKRAARFQNQPSFSPVGFAGETEEEKAEKKSEEEE
jgi:tetratricopeptide (TPR) repeat protein